MTFQCSYDQLEVELGLRLRSSAALSRAFSLAVSSHCGDLYPFPGIHSSGSFCSEVRIEVEPGLSWEEIPNKWAAQNTLEGIFEVYAPVKGNRIQLYPSSHNFWNYTFPVDGSIVSFTFIYAVTACGGGWWCSLQIHAWNTMKAPFLPFSFFSFEESTQTFMGRHRDLFPLGQWWYLFIYLLRKRFPWLMWLSFLFRDCIFFYKSGLKWGTLPSNSSLLWPILSAIWPNICSKTLMALRAELLCVGLKGSCSGF